MSQDETLEPEKVEPAYAGKMCAALRKAFKSAFTNFLDLDFVSMFSVLSSAFYTAAGTSRSRADLTESKIYRILSWVFGGAAVFSSEFTGIVGGGPHGLSPEQISVRTAVLIRRKSYKRAMKYFDSGLDRKDLKPHVRVLLFLGKAGALSGLGRHEDAYRISSDLFGRFEEFLPHDRPRFLRGHAEICAAANLRVEAEQSRKEAIALAEEKGWFDQVEKARALCFPWEKAA